jgi:hypothetical protein
MSRGAKKKLLDAEGVAVRDRHRKRASLEAET